MYDRMQTFNNETDVHLQHDDRQLFDQLQVCSRSLGTIAQWMNEKQFIVYNIQENFKRERNAMLYEISTLKKKLAVEQERLKSAAREREAGNSVGGEAVDRDGATEPVKSEVGLEQAERQRSESLEIEHFRVPHQALEPKFQKRQVQVLVNRKPETAASGPSVAEVEMESWHSARDNMSPSDECASQQAPRKRRKRALRRGDDG